MNERSFFEHQQLARRNSRVMVALFLLSVTAIVVVINLVTGVAYLWLADLPPSHTLVEVAAKMGSDAA